MKLRSKLGFTLLELLIALAFLSLLAALLFPVFAHAREKARQTACASNLRQIGMATMQYGSDNDGLHCGHADDSGPVTMWSFCWNIRTPPVQTVDTSCGPLAPFLRSADVWNCPSASGIQVASYFNPAPPPYGLNIAFVRAEISQGHPVSFAQAESPAETIFVADSATDFNGMPSWYKYVSLPSDHDPSVQGRHFGMASVVWLDGHVSARRPASSDAERQRLNIGDILKGALTGDAQTDDYYYELVKP